MNADFDARPKRDELAREWWFRAWAERQSAQRFERLTGRLEAAGAPAVVLEMSKVAADDERRHAILCADVARRYEVPDPFARVADEPPEIVPDALSVRDEALYEAMAFCCVTESINASLLAEMVRVSTEPIIRHAARDLMRDEVQHARLGWAFLAHEAAARPLPRASTWLPWMLAGAVSETLQDEHAPAASHRDHEHGYLDRDHRIEIFVGALEAVILPGVDAHGVHTGPARQWLARQSWRR